jgi:hypothetical protein
MRKTIIAFLLLLSTPCFSQVTAVHSIGNYTTTNTNILVGPGVATTMPTIAPTPQLWNWYRPTPYPTPGNDPMREQVYWTGFDYPNDILTGVARGQGGTAPVSHTTSAYWLLRLAANTDTPTPGITNTATNTRTNTPTNTATITYTNTATGTPTNTSTPTNTPIISGGFGAFSDHNKTPTSTPTWYALRDAAHPEGEDIADQNKNVEWIGGKNSASGLMRGAVIDNGDFGLYTHITNPAFSLTTPVTLVQPVTVLYSATPSVNALVVDAFGNTITSTGHMLNVIDQPALTPLNSINNALLAATPTVQVGAFQKGSWTVHEDGTQVPIAFTPFPTATPTFTPIYTVVSGTISNTTPVVAYPTVTGKVHYVVRAEFYNTSSNTTTFGLTTQTTPIAPNLLLFQGGAVIKDYSPVISWYQSNSSGDISVTQSASGSVNYKLWVVDQ